MLIKKVQNSLIHFVAMLIYYSLAIEIKFYTMILVDNKLKVAKIRLTYILTISAGALLVIYSIFSNHYAEGKFLSLVVGILLCLVFLYLIIIKPEYIFFSIEDNKKLIVRNYTAFPLFRKYKAYEIILSNIFDYEIKKAFFNQLIFIRILVKKNNKIGNYPWLSLSIVSKTELKKITDNLDKLIALEKRQDK
jgi:hypothetical protein